MLIVGASALGGETAERVLAATPAEVLLLDPEGERARATAGDLAAADGARVTGTDSWDGAAGAAVVVLVAGDVEAGARAAAERCPDAVVVVACEPVEENCGVALAATSFPRARVVGVAGVVESLRLRAGVARELGVSARDVTALVLGGRGERAVPVLRALRVGGTAVTDKLAAERVAAVVAGLSSGPPAGVRTVAAATAEVVAALACDRRAVLACALLCQGELGVQDAVAGVPVVLGARGVERVLDVTLDEDEAAALAASAAPYGR
ncbi:MAG: malate dehydrogenase [Solirubrobacteraceae bacterium]|nr:malate dehydrogenase [Solirubrobacteraceae bacterium]